MLTKSWLSGHNIPYIEKSVERPETAEELTNMGYRSTPVIIVNGQAIVGYNTKKLAEALLNGF